MSQFNKELNKKLVIVVPYRNRSKQYEIFLSHSKIYFNEDKLDKYLNLKLCFLEQGNDKPFNLGSLNNAGFLINENYLDYIVINNIDFLPMIADYSYSKNPMLLIKHGYNNLPILPSKDRRLIVKAPKRENVFLGSVLITKNIFKKVNGYSNSYWGWGFEDTDMKKRLDANKIKIYYRDGLYQPLIHDNLGFNINEENKVVESEYHINNRKTFNENWKDNQNYLKDGINNFIYKVISNKEVYKNFRNNALFEIRHIKVDF
jgi:hypothetical protein